MIRYTELEMRQALIEAKTIDAHALMVYSIRLNQRRVLRISFYIVILVLGGAVLRLLNLKQLYKKEFEWYDKAFAVGNVAPAQTGPTMFDVAMCSEYNAIYRFTYLFRMTPKEMPLEAAKFLSVMVRLYGRSMTAVHWCGSGAQLQEVQFNEFMGLNQMNATERERFDAWNDVRNPWRFLFDSPGISGCRWRTRQRQRRCGTE